MAHYDTIDDAGHEYGFSWNDQYISTLTQVDTLVGHLLENLLEHTKLHSDESWLILTTSDHGGHDLDHTDVDPEDSAVPFIVTILEAGQFSKTQLRPFSRPVRHYDVAPTTLKWLNIDASNCDFDGVIQGI